MAKQVLETIRRPRTDGQAVWGPLNGLTGYMALPIAHRRGLFQLLEGKRLSAAEIGDALVLQPRSVGALLSALTSLGLLELVDERYGLTVEAEEYLLESSPVYLGPIIDLEVAGGMYSFATLDNAVSTGSPQLPSADFATFEEQVERARAFTRAMHGISVAPALFWPELVDLAGDLVLLDVAGGSARTRSARACAGLSSVRGLDLPPVCDVADEFVAAQGLEEHITTHRADMWDDPFPQADVHSSRTSSTTRRRRRGGSWSRRASRRWAREVGSSSTRRSSTTTRRVEFPIAGFNMVILAATEGQQYSGRELTEMLIGAGFADVRITPAFQKYSVIEARRP